MAFSHTAAAVFVAAAAAAAAAYVTDVFGHIEGGRHLPPDPSPAKATSFTSTL
jgi:hypothetical protein